MTTNKELCTDLDASKMLAETGLMAGVKADGYWGGNGGSLFWDERTLTYLRDDGALVSSRYHTPLTACYRLDKILLRIESVPGSHAEASRLFELVMTYIRKKLIQQAANAAAELAHLLWKEGLIVSKE